MIVDADKKCERLAEKIASAIGQGIKLSADTLHYIDSTFSNPTPNEIADIIKDDSDCETDSLIELIFFPDESFQVQLEDLLERSNFGTLEERYIRDWLLSNRIETTLHFPDDRNPLKLKMPHSVIEPFISRLNISRRLDPKLLLSINENISANLRPSVKVKLRNFAKMPIGQKINFLCDFFKKMDAKDDQFLECLDFTLYLLADFEPNAEVYPALMERKRFYFKILKKAEKFEEKLKKNNMETLLLRGNRMPYINKSEAREKMRLIDKISLAVFGQTDFLQQTIANINLDVHNSDHDLKKIVKLLT
jgi:hypothetical protein